jgi:hypothetical protein
VVGLRQIACWLADVARHQEVDDHSPQDAALGAAHGRPGAHDVTAPEWGGRRDFLAAQQFGDDVGRIGGRPESQVLAVGPRDTGAVGGKHLQACQAELGTLGFDEALQCLTAARDQQVPRLRLLPDFLREVQGVVGCKLVIALGDVQRSFEGAFDADVEPGIEGRRQKPLGDEEQQRGGNQRQADEGQHQPRAQPRAEDPAPTFERELGQVAGHQEHEQDDQDNVQVDQQKEDDVSGGRRPAAETWRTHLHQREGEEDHRGDRNDHQFAPTPAQFVEGQPLPPPTPAVPPAGHDVGTHSRSVLAVAQGGASPGS